MKKLCDICKPMMQLRAENARLKEFAQYVSDHIKQTQDDGCVMVNTTPITLALRASQALKEPRKCNMNQPPR